MADAYKCDNCNEYNDGRPIRHGVFRSEDSWAYNEDQLEVELELCPDCDSDFLESVAEFKEDADE